jgi:hypothetical protein
MIIVVKIEGKWHGLLQRYLAAEQSTCIFRPLFLHLTIHYREMIYLMETGFRDRSWVDLAHSPPLTSSHAYCMQFLLQKNNCYVGVLISLWFFLFPTCSTTKRIFLGWVKEVRTTKPKLCGAQGGICRVNIFFESRSVLFSL